MTVRQRVRVMWLMGRKFQQTHRRVNETEFREILAQVLNEADTLLRAVGGLTIAWAEVEMFLDYTNGLLALNPALATKKFPRTTVPLEQKTRFLKNAFGMLPELAALHEKIPDLIVELERLQTIRNDVVHGVAAERTPVAVRKVMRVKAKGRSLEETYKTYQLGEIAYAGVDAIALRDKFITLFADTMRVLAPDQAKQFLSELPSFSTTLSAQQSPTGLQSGTSKHQLRISKETSIWLLFNAFAGLFIGGANTSSYGVFLSSLLWGLVTWSVVALIARRAAKRDKSFSGSLAVFVTGCISFATTLIVGSLTHAIYASFG